MKKKITLVLFSLGMILTVTACGGKENTPSAETAAEVKQEAVTSVDDEAKKAEEEAKKAEEEAKKAEKEAEEAKAKELEALYEEGRNALYGLNGTEVNYEKAFDTFSKLYELDNKAGAFYMGLMYDWIEYPEQNFKKAIKYYEQVADEDRTQVAMGYLYLFGSGYRENVEEARSIAEKLIDNGCTDAYALLGAIAREEGDYELRDECFDKVLEGNGEEIYKATALVGKGKVYYNDGDTEKAIELFEIAANEYGYTAAMRWLGYLYMSVDESYKKSAEWFTKGANTGDLDNISSLADLYYSYYFEDDVRDLAFEWATKGAERGDGHCMYILSDMYLQPSLGPEGMELDLDKSFEWAEKSANAGDPMGMEQCGLMYAWGYGVDQNYYTAIEWLQDAVDCGNENAVDSLNSVIKESKGGKGSKSPNNADEDKDLDFG